MINRESRIVYKGNSSVTQSYKLKMGSKTFFCLMVLSIQVVCPLSADAVDISVPQGMPVNWPGDAYNNTNCEIVTQMPTFLDGFFFCETSASYGDQSDPEGQKLIHMFDGISAVAKFDLNPVQSTFSGAYYPTESYKVWDLFSRDMTQSQVAWETQYSPWNNSQKIKFDDLVLNTMDYNDQQPNVDFWKIGTTIVTGTETYNLGLEFNPETLTNFKPYPFIENNTYFGPGKDPSYRYQSIHSTIHERTDLATGLLWNSVFTVRFTLANGNRDLHELVYTVDADGNRNIVGDYQYENFDNSKCDYNTGIYTGDWNDLPGYMHSTTSTENFYILPLTSSIFNPCMMTNNSPKANGNEIWDPTNPANADWAAYKLNLTVNQRFLLFDKRDSSFRMIHHNYPHFVTHQFNAYEFNDTMLYLDMIAYDENGDDEGYSGLYVETMMNFTTENHIGGAHLYRFTIDLTTNLTTNASLVPQDNMKFEFSQFNHHYEGLKYQYGYVLLNGYVKNSSVYKLDMDDPSGKGNLIWTAGFDVSLAEPYFVAKPGATKEDEGVILVRGLDVSINKTRLYALDAETFTLIGEIIAPDVVPFGFHNRYYSRSDLNVTATPTPPPPPSSSSAGTVVQSIAAIIVSMVISSFLTFSFK